MAQTDTAPEAIALIIIFNHRYDTNIEILERLYGHRFSHIFYLVPFYDGDRTDVIPVYENSLYFQGYIAQGLSRFFHDRFAHYLFLGDDCILNPAIDETNYLEHFRASKNTSFIPGLIRLHDCSYVWQRVTDAYRYRLNKFGVEATREMPTREEALKRFSGFGVQFKPFRWNQLHEEPRFSPGFLRSPRKLARYVRARYRQMRDLRQRTSYELSYPLVASYSDIVLVAKSSIRKFAQYCGVFAATDLMVEVAMPSALCLAADEIVTEDDLALRGKPLWTPQDLEALSKYNYELKTLLRDFPEGYLYLHPVKLSQWKTAE
jgi:hypothetical protein